MALPAGQIAFTLEYAQGLKDMDWVGRQDPYATVTCGVQHYRSRTHTDGGKNPVWNQTFTFNVINENTVQVELWDADVLSRDDKIGTCSVDLSKARAYGMDHQKVAVRTTRGRQHGFVSVKIAFTPNHGVAPMHHSAPPYPYGTPPAPYPTPAYAHQPSMYHAPPAAGTAYAPPPAPAPTYPAPAPYAQPTPGYVAAAPPPAAAPPAAPGYYPSVPTTQQYIPGPAAMPGPPPPMRLY